MPGINQRDEQGERLIAAAPDMLRALEIIRDSFWTDGESGQERVDHLQEIARAAIAKATTGA